MNPYALGGVLPTDVANKLVELGEAAAVCVWDEQVDGLQACVRARARFSRRAR